ncbi:hypothetical protein CBS101457_006071 [Exobasidium rhododendri]|nr:hypothetical protein CBS101457_006071 [Exobasidium rhododendri]
MASKNSMSSSQQASTENGAKSGSNSLKKRVLIIGAGCGGMSSAYALSLCPEKFDVKVYDKAPSVGGSATSYQLPTEEGKGFGAQYINDGVQGASPVFYNTFKMIEGVLGFKSSDVGLQISFGKGKETFWSNVFPSELVDEFKDDIKKFGKTLHTIKSFEPIFALIPVDKMLKMFRFSPSFGERMVYPLVALFFGTGNETKHISSAILERVFLDPSMRLFEFSEESFLASVPPMKAFPELSRVYGEWKKKAISTGNVVIESDCEVSSIERNTKAARVKGGNVLATIKGGERVEVFDEVIFACDADSALKILEAGSGPTWKEKKILGNVLYKWDVTVTHNDYDYMCKHYQMTYDDQYNAKRDDEESKKSFQFAKENWKPLYMIKMYEDDPSLIEMSFDLTHYQGQFEGMPAVGKDAKVKVSEALPTQRTTGEGGKQLISEEDAKSGLNIDEKSGGGVNNDDLPPRENHVYQTIYLNKDMSEKWTKDEVSKDKVILEKWWKQQSHRWQHYGGTVPWMWTINGKNNTHFAGAWTLVNMHEVGIVSGFSAAYQLGAPYPFKEDEECARLFRLYLALAHMSRMRGEDRQGFFA